MCKGPSCLTLLFVAVVGTGCYHATIETGATPSPTVVRKPFAPAWIYGLVPPSTVSTASQCPNGVARVETQLSFVNQLVGFLTFGIYTPMEIVVSCAAARGASREAPADAAFVEFDAAAPAGLEQALSMAVLRSRDEHRAIYIRAR